MLLVLRGLAVVMLAVSCSGPSSSQPGSPTPPLSPSEPAPASERIFPADEHPRPVAEESLEIAAAETTIPYDRDAWADWIDEDGDCQDTRTEVLIAEAIARVELEGPRGCEVAAGEWQCPYTGEIVSEAHLLDIDHLVPLANVHRSGGAEWDADRRRQYANDLAHEHHLVAVDYTANRSKGAKGPEAWLPPDEEFRCTYVREWAAIKARWKLRMTEAEAAAIRAALEMCDAGQVPPRPGAGSQALPSLPGRSEAASDVPGQAGECCRVCKKGKACGDSCISRESSCMKPPGCACDG